MNWKLFFSAFITLFIAELGDKTQLAVFCMSADKNQPIPIFLGASLALVLVTFLGVFFGEYISKFIPEYIIKIIAGCLFIAIGIFVLRESIINIIK
ncbi:MAG TPA: TMEM165/GDT1 family protein [Defluviitaleaceae bacterium]|jgi:putative Ca2+/H+ antiporter (TMEM165/GDT1 family)|nr:TMEM165/GDT1 family protein [Candidatus Epulonipiscium sp.]HOA81490.1 TMEM165/GDT1 family protein [Defluviitaleaceae bacterium]